MSWSLPRKNKNWSQKFYDKEYKSYIQKYNHMLVDLKDFYVVKNFCIETLTKNNNVPVHCIDILWPYMSGINIEFNFCNDYLKTYIGILPIDKMIDDKFSMAIVLMNDTSDGDGSLLDHSLILYGSGMSESDIHSRLNIPTAIVGGGAGLVKGNRHIQTPKETPIANLMVDFANKFGCEIDKFGALSTGRVEI